MAVLWWRRSRAPCERTSLLAQLRHSPFCDRVPWSGRGRMQSESARCPARNIDPCTPARRLPPATRRPVPFPSPTLAVPATHRCVLLHVVGGHSCQRRVAVDHHNMGLRAAIVAAGKLVYLQGVKGGSWIQRTYMGEEGCKQLVAHSLLLCCPSLNPKPNGSMLYAPSKRRACLTALACSRLQGLQLGRVGGVQQPHLAQGQGRR